ncbi:hypothetical protein [Mariniluteicoccus flavus]
MRAFAIGRVVAETFWLVVVEPVRDGMPRWREWPRGMAPIGVVTLAAYVVAGATIWLAPVVRRVDPMVAVTDGRFLGTWSVVGLLWLATVVLALAVTALLHVHPLARWLGLVAITLTLAVVGLGSTSAGPMAGLVVGVMGLWVLALARVGRRFSPVEFPVVLALLSLAVFVPLAFRGSTGMDVRGSTLLLLLTTLFVWAMPGLMMAGFAFAEVTVSTAEWFVDRLGVRLARPDGMVVLRLLALALTGIVAVRGGLGIAAAEWEWRPVVWAHALAVLFVTAAASAVLMRVGRRSDGSPPRPAGAAGRWRGLAWLLAGLLALNVVPMHLAAVLQAVLTLGGVRGVSLTDALASETAVAVVRVIASTTAGALAVRAAGRGDRLAALVLTAFAVHTVASALGMATGGRLASESLPEVMGVVLALSAAAVAVVRWRTPGTWVAALGVLALTALYPARTTLSEPTTVIGGLSAAAVLFVGLVWRVLTDGALFARGHSRAFPRASRVLLYFANGLFGAVVLAYSSLVRTHDPNVDVAAFTELGDRLLGTPLFVGACLAGLMVAATVRRPAPAAKVLVPRNLPNGSNPRV